MTGGRNDPEGSRAGDGEGKGDSSDSAGGGARPGSRADDTGGPASGGFRVSPPAWIQPGVCRVTLSGDLDRSAAPALQPALAPLLAEPRLQELQQDLSAVPFIDAAGLGALVTARRTARDRGASVALAACGGQVLRLLQATRLVYFFRLTP